MEGQSGRQSHYSPNPTTHPHRIAIPAQKSLRVGTLNSILRDVANHKKVARDAIVDLL
jgi:hypothetical protein